MTESTKKPMKHGEMDVYEINGIQLHAYATKDPLNDETFVLVKNGNALVIEPPCFKDNISELEKYINGLDVNVAGKLVSYHAAGATFLPEVKTYGTASAKAYNENGGGAALVNDFIGAFGESFDGSMMKITEILNEGENVIGDIKIRIIPKDDAYEIELPEVNAVYIHMLGHDSHSIVAGAGHADSMISDLEGYLDKGFELFLSSHYVPEDVNDVHTKIAYLNDIKAIASGNKNGKEFETEVKSKYPEYPGVNYLDMTAGFFFPE